MYATGMRVGEAVQLARGRHRQPADDDPGGPRQREQAETGAPVPEAAHGTATVLADPSQPGVAVSQPATGQAPGHRVCGDDLPAGTSPSWPETPLQHARPAAHVRHGTAGSRSRSVLHSEDPGTPLSEHDGALHARAAQAICRRPASPWICCPWNNSARSPPRHLPRKPGRRSKSAKSSAATEPAFLAARGSRLSVQQRKVLAALAACRTAAMGGHLHRCNCLWRRDAAL